MDFVRIVKIVLLGAAFIGFGIFVLIMIAAWEDRDGR